MTSKYKTLQIGDMQVDGKDIERTLGNPIRPYFLVFHALRYIHQQDIENYLKTTQWHCYYRTYALARNAVKYFAEMWGGCEFPWYVLDVSTQQIVYRSWQHDE